MYITYQYCMYIYIAIPIIKHCILTFNTILLLIIFLGCMCSLRPSILQGQQTGV